MLSTEDEQVLAKYKEVHVVTDREKCSVSLVINIEDNQIAVKKVIRSNKIDVYKKLMEVQSENIPQIYHVMEDDEYFIVIEEFAEGLTLQELLKSSDFITEEKLYHILEQLFSAMKLIHNLPSPIIHRDIKPSNIIISKNGNLKLIDFDAAREFNAQNNKDTVCLGTIEYAAPEQFGYAQTDIRSDIYSVGMLIAEFLKHYNELKPNQRFHTAFQKVVDKCTMFDPKQRYQSVDELEEIIRKIRREMKDRRYLRYLIPVMGVFIIGVIILVSILKTKTNHDIFYADTSGDQVTMDEMTPQLTPKPSATPQITEPAVTELPQDSVVPSPISEITDTSGSEIAENETTTETVSNTGIIGDDEIKKEVQDEDISEDSSDSKNNDNDKKAAPKVEEEQLIPTNHKEEPAEDTVEEQEKTEDTDKVETSGNNIAVPVTPMPEIDIVQPELVEPPFVNGFRQPVFYTAWNSFYKSNPQDIIMRIVWYDATKVIDVSSFWENTPPFSDSDYIIDNDKFVIKKEALSKLEVGQYRWLASFDTNFGNCITIDVFD